MLFKFLKNSNGKVPVKLLYARSTIVSIGNQFSCAGLPSLPKNWLDRKLRICSSGRDPNQNGKVSIIRLWLRSRHLSNLQLAIDLGSGPSTKL
uniref:Uncharacterized protein n=1 Tax=Rhizophora mucronata TaxID=61149 RepID=A0A2P2IVX3_RHIMU